MPVHSQREGVWSVAFLIVVALAFAVSEADLLVDPSMSGLAPFERGPCGFGFADDPTCARSCSYGEWCAASASKGKNGEKCFSCIRDENDQVEEPPSEPIRKCPGEDRRDGVWMGGEYGSLQECQRSPCSHDGRCVRQADGCFKCVSCFSGDPTKLGYGSEATCRSYCSNRCEAEGNGCWWCSYCPQGSGNAGWCKERCGEKPCVPFKGLLSSMTCYRCECPPPFTLDKSCGGRCRSDEYCGEAGLEHGCYTCHKRLEDSSGSGTFIGGEASPCPANNFVDPACGGTCKPGWKCLQNYLGPMGCYLCVFSPSEKVGSSVVIPGGKEIGSGTGKRGQDTCIDINKDGFPDQCRDNDGDGSVSTTVLRSFGLKVLERSEGGEGTLGVKKKDGSVAYLTTTRDGSKIYLKLAGGVEKGAGKSREVDEGYHPYEDVKISPSDITVPGGSTSSAGVRVQPGYGEESSTAGLPCDQVCSRRGMSSQPLSLRSYLEAKVGGLRCVSGASVGSVRVVLEGSCRCYSGQMPEVSIDRTVPVCKTPCGDLKCDEKKECPCGPGCTIRASCSWGGWSFTETSAKPRVMASSASG